MSATDVISTELTRVPPDEVPLLVARVKERFGDALLAVLFYGSCRRHGVVADSILDFYAVIESRRREKAVARWAGSILPPNVYFESVVDGTIAARGKVGAFTLADLKAAPDHAESYTWARFAQPMSLVYCIDDATRASLLEIIASCTRRFLSEALPLAHDQSVLSAWTIGLRRSYETELRPESKLRPEALVAELRDYCLALTQALMPSRVVGSGGDARVLWPAAAADCERGWRRRRWRGKLRSFLRLVKGLVTFDGALDYVVWKLTRHSGVAVEIPQRVRRWPWVFVWGLFFKLYRQGLFR